MTKSPFVSVPIKMPFSGLCLSAVPGADKPHSKEQRKINLSGQDHLSLTPGQVTGTGIKSGARVPLFPFGTPSPSHSLTGR